MSVIKILIVVVVVIVVIAILIGYTLNHTKTSISGGKESFYSEWITYTPDTYLEPPDYFLQTYENPTLVLGGNPRGDKTDWTSYKTWDELEKNKEALDKYWKDCYKILKNLNIDWSDIRKELGDKLYDNKEWIGRINMVDGKLKIVEIVPSTELIGVHEQRHGVHTHIPEQIVSSVATKPALFLFHTHPGEVPGSLIPSPIDILGSVHRTAVGHYASDIIFSPYGTFLYTPNNVFRSNIWKSGDAKVAYIETLKRALDIAMAIDGSKSWKSPWSLDDYTNMLSMYDMELVVFPTDKYANAKYRAKYATPCSTIDPDLITKYRDMIKEAEIKYGKHKKSECPKKVRFIY